VPPIRQAIEKYAGGEKVALIAPLRFRQKKFDGLKTFKV
jgi:hypothetical protein